MSIPPLLLLPFRSPLCSTLLSVSVIIALTKSNLGSKEYILSHLVRYITKGSQGGNSRQRLKAETNEKHCLLTYSSVHIS